MRNYIHISHCLGRLYSNVRERLYPAVMEEPISTEREEIVSNREGELTSLGLICTVSMKMSVFLTLRGKQYLTVREIFH
jgi:hypothetical protein